MENKTHWNTEQIRQYNRSLVLKTIYDYSPITKSEISKRTNLTIATVGNIASKLLETRTIGKAGYGESDGGRKPILYEFNWDQYYVIALDIGVTKVTAALADFKGAISHRHELKLSDVKQNIDLIEKIYNVVDLVIDESEISLSRIVGIGVSAPGPIDVDEGEILTPPNLLGIENVKLKRLLEMRYGFITTLEKDANAAALAEQWFGNANQNENILYIYADQGIGGGMIVNSRIYRGFKSGAGEIGHISIDIDGPRCNCGNFGCLEALASGISIIKRVKQEIHRGVTSSLTDLYLNDEQNLTLEAIVEHSKNGDVLAIGVLNEASRYLGIGVTNAMNFFAPTLIIFGGQLIELNPEVIQLAENIAKERAFSTFAKDIQFTKSSFTDQSGLIGAASIIQQKIFDQPEKILI